MKSKILLFVISFLQLSCHSQQAIKIPKNDNEIVTQGVFIQKDTGLKLQLTNDGYYTLFNPESNEHFVIEQCEYASKGKWKQLSNDVLEIISENYYVQQEGFKYDLKKENKYSKDSIYIEIKLPNEFLNYRRETIKSTFYFNHNTNKSITTKKGSIVIAKEKYLFAKPNEVNHIGFSLNADVLGTSFYKSRIMFKVFEEDINTEKYNYLTINLPNFNLCFYEFEPYNHELIYIKDKKELIWQGESWKKTD